MRKGTIIVSVATALLICGCVSINRPPLAPNYAVSDLHPAASNGKADYAFSLAQAYARGIAGVGKNLFEQQRYLLLAAEAGYAQAQFQLANNFLLGSNGFAQDSQRGLYWASRLQQSNFGMAAGLLASAYGDQSYRSALTPDPVEAYKWSLFSENKYYQERFRKGLSEVQLAEAQSRAEALRQQRAATQEIKP